MTRRSPWPLVALLLAATGCGPGPRAGPGAGSPGGEAPGDGQLIITEADSGKRFELSPGDRAVLRLDSDHPWQEPRVRGRSVEVTRVDYFQDPGFLEWELRPVRAGTTVVTASCLPRAACPEDVPEFRVTLTVSG